MTTYEPIYEVLAPGEVLILYKEGDCLTYIVNHAGVARLRKTDDRSKRRLE